ncbi:uncharacterized protein M421DRAFT_104398 [Didymella exigua CBS 183.55]|uniref:DH domain-containing protein n=1 Tax=Didymella exigua CBS 183.55 TaxID=1150837 RepID=A0A6A5RCQ9_9PLEO|nr:uncharacterized protein M421DRAFT_104398 [Didymella exigua CBS 183.55]KAF1923527.1 hypothetical protein M421DRAFT_104398 [Didymella exigua CBS 183.55]
MPAPPADAASPREHASPGKKRAPAVMSGNDFAKAIGISKPANVRDKIKRWQQDGGNDAAVAGTDDDDATPSADVEPKTSRPKSQPPTPKTTTKPTADKPNWQPAPAPDKPNWQPAPAPSTPTDHSPQRATPAHNELDDDVHSAVAPKKRVVSDSHWRAKQSPPKDAARPPPKTIPNAWVRPSRIVKKDKLAVPEDVAPAPSAPPTATPAPPTAAPPTSTPAPAPTLTPTPKTPLQAPVPQTLAKYISKSTGQKKGAQRQRQRQRRASKPASSKSDANEERPVSSGSGSAKEPAVEPESPQRKKDRSEVVKVRRRNTQTSPRASLSAEDAEPVKQRPGRRSEPGPAFEHLANLVTVEYAESSVSPELGPDVTSPRADELRERRRRRRQSRPMSDDEGFRESTRRHRRTKTDTVDMEKEDVMRALRAVQPRALSPPNKVFASRLEAWLDRTQQMQDAAEQSERLPPRRRRRSKEPARESSAAPAESSATQAESSAIQAESFVVPASTKGRHQPAPVDPAPAEETTRPAPAEETTRLAPAEEATRPATAEEATRPASAEETTRPASAEETTRPRSSGSGSGSASAGGSRRRRRRRSHEQRRASRELKIDTTAPVAEEAASPVGPDGSAAPPLPDKAEPEPEPEPPEAPLSPTPTLKRRGARRKSQHMRSKSSTCSPLRESMSTDDLTQEDTARAVSAASSALSSSVGASSVDFDQPSLRPRPLAVQRRKPARGKRLSTIASVDSLASKAHRPPGTDVARSERSESVFSDDRTVTASEVGSQLNETSTIVSRRSTRKNRLASHADLISVLSMPKAGAKSIVSARSIRTNRSRLATATIPDIMNELADDEAKYMRELRTIVDGVIPVLLSCVLSKTDSAVAVGLFSRSAKSDPSEVTKPIVDMGLCLERLKTLHKRVPKQDSDGFLSWAQSAQRVYGDYISVWRLGFQDVVISLAPADDDPFKPAKIVNGPDDGAPWDEGMPRNADGYVVNGDGERVDVAYMLKRPLVRLKYLAKTLKGLNHVQPSERADKIAATFHDLVTAARKRSNDEQARLEDEAASSIDATRARDPRSLAPLAGVRIDAARCVRARDYFDLYLYHSTSQELSCRVELLLRDNAPGTAQGGDVLLCEVDSTGRWLLLPPIQQSRISARNGDVKGEIVVMIRGNQADGSEWSEVMSLTADDEQAGFEWVQMLGLTPIPPPIADIKRDQTVPGQMARPTSSHGSSLVSVATASTAPFKSRTPSPHEIEIPLGEQHTGVSKVWNYDTPDRRRQSRTVSPVTPPSADGSLANRNRDAGDGSLANRNRDAGDVSLANRNRDAADVSPPEPQANLGTVRRTRRPDADADQTPRSSFDDATRSDGTASPTGLKRTKAKRLSRTVTLSTVSQRPSRQITLDDPIEFVDEPKPIQSREAKIIQEEKQPRRKSTKRRGKNFSVWMPTSEADCSDESDGSEESAEEEQMSPPGSPPRPGTHRRVSSTPSMELPSIPRLRKSSQPSTSLRDAANADELSEPPASAPPALSKAPKTRNQEDDAPPPPPPHRSPSPATPVTLKGSKTPNFTPALPGWKTKRRSSSPLKHEYEPSTCTESSSESEEDVVSEDDASESDDVSLTSESSEDELDDDIPTPLMPLSRSRSYATRPSSAGRDAAPLEPLPEESKEFPSVSPPASIYTLPNGTITPSQSASNQPYRAVPTNSGKATKAVGSIFSWSDAGRWDSLHPDECSIVVTPGKIEVFEITAAHSKPLVSDGDEIIQPGGRAPLIAVELTPLVPLRKSTAIDISIRSPPTSDSRIATGNNIMLRSRNATECAQLYAMINQSRINNPTYIALQNARGPYGHTSWAEAMDRRNEARTNASSGSGLFGGTLGRRSSYRKSSTRAASISAATESSVGTMGTAMRSALSRFSFGKGGMFSVRNSTLESQSLNSFDTGSSGSLPGSGASSPNGPGGAVGAPAGITNTKCRLYERESLKKWRDMGGARLTIMLPSPNPSAPGSPNPLQRSPGTRDHTQERRIVVTSKKDSQILLDVTLSETCFERVARSGIAVSVWEDNVDEHGQVGQVAHTGGVNGARARVFMIQMKSEREAAYCFSLLGKMRY